MSKRDDKRDYTRADYWYSAGFVALLVVTVGFAIWEFVA